MRTFLKAEARGRAEDRATTVPAVPEAPDIEAALESGHDRELRRRLPGEVLMARAVGCRAEADLRRPLPDRPPCPAPNNGTAAAR